MPTGRVDFDLLADTPLQRLSEAFCALGMLTAEGVRIVADVLGKLDSRDKQTPGDSRRLTHAKLARLENKHLITPEAVSNHVDCFYQTWQLPMYNIDFGSIGVTLEELERERDFVEP